MTAPNPPAHIVATGYDRRSLCGVKDPLPLICAPFVQAHVDGYGLLVCDACATVVETQAVPCSPDA
jgi:hypothetical protein